MAPSSDSKKSWWGNARGERSRRVRETASLWSECASHGEAAGKRNEAGEGDEIEEERSESQS